uniref:Tubulin--tyrosine ligase-like protein 12 n=1 Tax=Mesocestoides corti TaxID=53468 RepID=A0A5K3EHW7_MESCO
MQQYTYDDFLRDHCTALESMKVPELYWPALHSKLLGKEFDVPQHFELGLLNYTDPESGDVVDKELFVSVKSDEILSSDSDSIFLIDHAWTFELADVRKTLVSNPSLLSRMVNLMCLNEKEINGNESAAVDEFMRKMWKFCHLYQISKPSEVDGDHIVIKKDVWYILDEFGSSIKQSSEPNVRVASFMYVPERLCYSVFWPIVDLHKEDTLYVDWLSAVTDSDKKSLLLLPWEDQDFSDRSSAHSYVLTDDFFSSHKIQESLPEPGAPFVSVCSLPLKVYTDINLVAETLSSPSYEVTEERNEADILWLYSHFRDYNF